MRVIQQLIGYFWDRQVLTLEEVHYLVEHGFVTPEELEGYQPRPLEPDRDEEPEPERRPPVEVLVPDEWDQQREAATERAERRGRGGRGGARPADYRLEDLCRDLAALLAAREAYLPALVELGRRLGPCQAWPEAAVVLRQADPGAFRAELARELEARPPVLTFLWEALDAEGYYRLLAREEVRGPAPRAFGHLLRAADPGQLGPAAWIFRGEEVQVVANLLQVRRRLLGAIRFLYDQHFPRLARSLTRPRPRTPARPALDWGLVLLYNARARAASAFPPPGILLTRRPEFESWRQAWTTALALDPACATRYFAENYGRPRELSPEEEQATLWNVEVFCPPSWRV